MAKAEHKTEKNAQTTGENVQSGAENAHKTAKKARNPVGAPRKYKSPLALKKAINKYFASISREIEITEMKWNGKYDDKGKPVYEPQTVLNMLGEPAKKVEYIVKPSIQGLCTSLGICKDTWAEYSKREGYAEVCAAAKLEMERDRVDRLGSGKGDQGIEFDLTYNFGWKKEVTIEAGAGMQKALEAQPKSIEEQLEFLHQMGLRLPGEEET